MAKRILVAYFSRTGDNYFAGDIRPIDVGNTARVAAQIAEKTGGELYEIVPAKPYPKAYRATTDLAQKELDEEARPALANPIPDLSGYDAVFVGYPIWWGRMPRPVMTFLEGASLAGKDVFPFCTHEGSGIGRSADEIKTVQPGCRLSRGFACTGTSSGSCGRALDAWLKTLPL